MKVLLVHNYYQSSSPSGEDEVFKAEKELLKAKGIRVVTYERHNDEILRFSSYKKLSLPFRLIWSREVYKELRDLIKRERPDIAHFHNIFYLISPGAYYVCKELDLPVIQTLHNFRLFCANGLLMRKGNICEKCIGRLPWRSIFYGCYRGSRFYSMPVALMEYLHRFLGTWKDKVDLYIALTEFGQKKFIECGLPKERILVKPNFLLNPPAFSSNHKDYVVFIGRLSPEKGIFTLIEAFEDLLSLESCTLKIIGDGPLRRQIEDKIREKGIRNIELLGKKGLEECMKLLKEARFLIMPSRWYETFGRIIIEAFACGKPVIASRLGAMAEIVKDGQTGLLFEPGNSKDLATKIKWMIKNQDLSMEMGRKARMVFEEKYTSEKNYKMLLEIYKRAIK
jgi:glycosyltransferase involved in cell wall biosynthesis